MMPNILKAVLFDLDGTLLDTAPDFAVVVNRLCQQHGRAAISYEAIRATVSHGARALITLAFQLQPGEDNFEPLRQQLLALYADHLAVNTAPFDGIPELLGYIEHAGLDWGIVTNKPRIYTEAILLALDLDQRCSTVVCPDDVSQTKPHPESLLLACKHIACQPRQAIYVGDHRRDIEAGNNAGMKTIAAAYGYIDPDDPIENWQADYSVAHATDTIAILQAYTGH